MSTQFYFNQKFRNNQIKIIYNILQLPKTKENNIFINNLLTQINLQLYNYYYPRKPSFINDTDFLNKLGNKGITETINKIIETIKIRNYEEQQRQQQLQQQRQQQQQQQQKTKEEYESMIRPKLSDDNINPDDILAQKQREREEFDKTLPNRREIKTLEDVGLSPVSTKKQKYKPVKETDSNNQALQQQQTQQQQQQQQPQNQINNYSMPQNSNYNNSNISTDSLVYKNDIKPLKQNKHVDFSKPIDEKDLMPSMNTGDDDNNFSPF